MTLLNWVLLVVGAAIAIGFAYITYFRREPAGRGRSILMGLRATTLVLLILLLIDPQLGAAPRTSRNNTRVVLDASLSMQPRAADSAAWQQALRTARESAAGGIILAGDAPRSIHADSLNSVRANANTSRVLPALQAAAEAGAQRVVLVTDGAIEDAGDVARWLPRLGVDLEVKRMEAASTPNRAITELQAPAWAEARKPVTFRASVATRAAPPGAKIPVVIKQNGSVVARTEAVAPNDGRMTNVEMTFNASGPAAGGLVRYDVAFEEADSIPDDDVRSAYVFVSEKPAGIAIVSFGPDWEPKFLHPVLAQALGLPVRTFLRMPTGTYLRAGGGMDAGTRADESAVRAALAQAELVVLHGVSENAPTWWRETAARSRRVIIFPADALGDPYEVTAPATADWYASAEVPASPIAPFLQNMQLGELPALESAFTMTAPNGSWTPLYIGRTRRGGRVPALLAHEQGGRRVAIALATGYWRWAFRGGPARDVYTRMWGALAGWIAQEHAQVAGAAIRPVTRTVPRGQPMRWIAPGLAFDSLHVQVGEARSTVTQLRGDTALTASLAPGHYQYQARAFAGGEIAAEASGPLTVESYSAEFMRAPADLSDLRSNAATLVQSDRGSGRRLHTSPWPYLLLVLMLCAEWVFRRRWGLR
jgi:hypothetical protein